MTLEERIENEFKAALKERNAVKVSTLRMLKAEMTNVKIKINKKELADGDLIKIIKNQVARHKDSIGQFEKGNRPDLARKEKEKLSILSGYLPAQMPEEELKKIVSEAISELGASGKKDMGKVIKAVLDKTKGRADGKAVSQLVSGMLE